MIPVLAIGSLKSSGTTTLALTLASVTAAANIPVTIIDAARDADATAWSKKRGVPSRLQVVRETSHQEIERMVRGARRRGEALIIDCGSDPDLLRFAERMADKTLIPVRFSPLSAYAAIATDKLFDDRQGIGRPDRERLFVASAITPIHSRVAKAVESVIGESRTHRLSVGLSMRAAYEAPFLHGGSLFSLNDDEAPGLDRARAEAATLAYAVGLLQVQTKARGKPSMLDAQIAA